MPDALSVFNLKCRIAELPVVSLTDFQEQVLSSHDGKKDSVSFEKSCDACEQRYTNRKMWMAHLQSSIHARKVAVLTEPTSAETKFSKDVSPSHLSPTNLKEDDAEDVEPEGEEEEEEVFSPLQCLFCNAVSESLKENMEHMSQSHSFLIPDTEHLVDLESFLSYLFAIVAAFHECLFCGCLRESRLGIQSHMRDKGHCKLNFDNDHHGTQEFYEFTDDEDAGTERKTTAGATIDGAEMRLPSGKILGRRSQTRNTHRPFQKESSPELANLEQAAPHLDHIPLPPESKDRTLALRAGTSSSLIGVSQLQQRALMAVEKKILKVETIAKKEYEARVERGGNRQKRYKVASMGKKQGGLEKRLG